MEASSGSPKMKEKVSSIRHARYYLDLVTFKVEDTLFRIPKCFVDQGQVFKDMWIVCSEPGQTSTEGSSDECPILLDGVTKDEFALFLEVLIPIEPALITDDSPSWITVLRLCVMWGFTSLQAKAIEVLSRLLSEDPFLRIQLSEQYSIPSWTDPAIKQIAEHPAPPNVDEIAKLTPSMIVGIMKEREIRIQTMFLEEPWDPRLKDLPGVSTISMLQKKILDILLKENASQGVHVTDIAERLKRCFLDLSAEQVNTALENLLDEGWIYTTIDELHFASST